MDGTVRRLRIALGTLVAIEASSPSPTDAEAAVEAAFAAILEVDQRLHPRSPRSDLARVNNAPLDTPVTVHPSVCELLQLAQRLHDLSHGVFDPCLPLQPGRLLDIEIGSEGRVVCRAPVAVDFGGFAKGYAVDRAIDALAAHGCDTGLVNAGGDLRVFGPRTESILLRGPSGAFTPVEIEDTALAASDADSQRRPVEHQGYYNRVDLAGRTHSALVSEALTTRFAAVIAPTACIADALVKCMMLCPMDTSTRILSDFAATGISCDSLLARAADDRGQQPLPALR